MKDKFDKNIHDRPQEEKKEEDFIAEQTQKEQQFLRLAELLRTDAKCGELLSAFFLDELGYAELAVQKGVSEASLRQRKKRCLEKFRKVW